VLQRWPLLPLFFWQYPFFCLNKYQILPWNGRIFFIKVVLPTSVGFLIAAPSLVFARKKQTDSINNGTAIAAHF
jgi:hypothetical protein